MERVHLGARVMVFNPAAAQGICSAPFEVLCEEPIWPAIGVIDETVPRLTAQLLRRG